MAEKEAGSRVQEVQEAQYDSEEDMLEYDDSAFFYFSISILTAILLPFTWSLLKSIIWGDTEI